jgi:sugar O-acyltransferase (sialic acid O-acetyltransferase NeuD family)
MTDLYIVGAGDFGKETADTVAEINAGSSVYNLLGFIDDDPAAQGTVINGVPVLGGTNYLIAQAGARADKPAAVITVAGPATRQALAEKLDPYVEWTNIIHPQAIIKPSARIGKGNIIQHFSSINSNAELKDHCIVNCNCVIGHDVLLSDYCSVMPQSGLMGFCKMGERVYIGVGVAMIPHVTVGADAVIGAGAVVLKDVEAGATVVGNPLRRIK